MSKKITFSIIGLVIIILGVVTWNNLSTKPEDSFVEKRIITFAEGSLTAPCYPITKVITDVWNKYLPNIISTPELDPGRLVDNLKNIEEGKFDFRWTMSNLAFYSYNGLKIEDFKGNSMKSLRTLGSFWNQELHLIVSTDSLINDITDFKGQKVKVVVPSEKAWMAITAKELFGMHGISPDLVEITSVPLSEIAGSLKAKDADIAVLAISIKSTQSKILKKAEGLRFLSLSQEIIKKTTEKLPYYVEGSIPKNTYPNQTNDVSGIIIKGTIVCREDMDSDLVYALTKTMFDHIDEIKEATPLVKDMFLEAAVTGLAIPLHPGAAKYYTEMGLTP